MRSRLALILAFALVPACRPPASDDYVARVGLEVREEPRAPIDTPDTQGAGWAPGRNAGRIIYGKPGERPLFALECTASKSGPAIVFTRHAVADPEAQAVLALIGNGHVERLWIDAVRVDGTWLWRGSVPADSAQLEGLTGSGRIEATVPGAGSLILNPSGLPGRLISDCRARAGRRGDRA
ncbi:hypothetical protein [Qipengyuania sp. MTN3-11]|uniref:hypothetical protein n=1 Tax=Qipengyuania sp. MTN3-11 TaxID=3056557 RepID=UPI0036F1F8A0